MKKIIAIASLSFLSLFAQASEVNYSEKYIDKVADLKNGQWNYFKTDQDGMIGKFSSRKQDSQNKNNIAIVFSRLKNKNQGLFEYPFIGFASDEVALCNTCEIKVSFDNKTYENYQLKEVEKNTYKINKTGQFYKKFSQSNEVYIEFPNLGKYNYHFADVNFDMPTTNWMVVDTVEESLNLPIHLNILESNSADGTISIYKTKSIKPMVGVLIDDNFTCPKSACVLNVSLDNNSTTFTAFQYQNELMVDDSEKFISSLNNSNIIKVSIKGSPSNKVFVFDNTIKDYQ